VHHQRRAHHMRQSLPIPSAPLTSPVLRPFSPPQAPSIACAAPPIPHSLFLSPTPIVSLPPLRPSASSQARHNSPTRTSVLSAPPLAQRAAPGSGDGQCGRLQCEIAAHTQREDTLQWAPAAIAGTGARVGDSSNAISADFSDTVHIYLTVFTCFLLLSLDVVLSHLNSSM
jgi:hypothetical protein